MSRIIALSGSLRRHSYNSGLLRAARQLMPDGVALEIGTIADVPLYNGDIEEEEGIPAAVTRLKDAIADADGLLLSTPEYNNSIPGVFKNAIDWISRPPADSARVFRGKRVAIIGASPGGFGTVLAQNAWLPVLRTLGVELWNGRRLMVSEAGQIFDAEGNLVNESIRNHLKAFLEEFAAVLGE
ncbi:NADPH-dependent FMN reductase [Rhizorhapis sp. SPR117]|uniref:NADPH-dependent FMN reductase n=1 Tax=Rhizorhapis sp. SPR117 TaxID=2912611 RepID=UPI001F1768C4|nr:NAD(P)H-dependent oxidoreductase [Rhizorhapis sp. SPR117]